jgi:magnesium-transporting ATPase (P-type)
MRLNSVYNISFVSNENGRYFIHSLYNSSHHSILVMSTTGTLQLCTWMSGPLEWNVFWSVPWDQSHVYGLCGAFGVFYHENFLNPCECLKGFEPFSMEDISLKDCSSGCVRKSPL